ncbi:unnamed protein product [marine sediment metagenome]|uniref:Uncharacterized protein n=1 Tax=marine sediment metagenome TaxID=412755 RepID=X0VK57_9ZZZZ
MTCNWESEHGWCQYGGRLQWLNSIEVEEGPDLITESVNIKCIDMKPRCEL